MNQTEIFELCENSAKLQCPDCNAFSEIRIVYCSYGRNLKYKRSPTTTQEANCDFTSIPGFVTKKNSSRGPKHDASERQVGGMHKKDTESHWRNTILAKRKLCFPIASLLKDMTLQLNELNGYSTPNIGLFV